MIRPFRVVQKNCANRQVLFLLESFLHAIQWPLAGFLHFFPPVSCILEMSLTEYECEATRYQWMSAIKCAKFGRNKTHQSFSIASRWSSECISIIINYGEWHFGYPIRLMGGGGGRTTKPTHQMGKTGLFGITVLLLPDFSSLISSLMKQV